MIFFGTFSLSLIGKFTNQVRAIEAIATMLIGLALVIGLLKLLVRIPALKSGMNRYPKFLRSVTRKKVFSLTLITKIVLSITALLINPESTQAHEPALSGATSDKAVQTQPAPSVAPVASTAPVATTAKIDLQVVEANTPPTKLSAPHKSGNEARGSVVVSAQPARTKPLAPVKVAATRPPRCALILQKAAIDELVSPEDREFLTSSC